MLRRLLTALLLAAPLGLAGCLSGDDATPAALAQPDPSVAAPEPVPVELEGRFALASVHCPLLTCLVVNYAGRNDRLFPFEDVSGLLSEVQLEATWTATAPNMRELRLGVLACGGECASDEDVSESFFVDGPSPLKLDVEDFEVPEGETLYVFMWTPFTTPVLYNSATAPQEFRIAGVLVPADASAMVEPAEDEAAEPAQDEG